MKTIATYRNTDDGIEARIMDGNDKFDYRVIVRDIDAEETITICFCNSYAQCVEFAKTLFIDGYTIEEAAACYMMLNIDYANRQSLSTI